MLQLPVGDIKEYRGTIAMAEEIGAIVEGGFYIVGRFLESTPCSDAMTNLQPLSPVIPKNGGLL